MATGGSARSAAIAFAVLLALPAPAGAKAPPLQALQTVRTIHLQLPQDVETSLGATTGNPGVELAPDEKHIDFPVQVGGAIQIGMTRLGGSGFTCLTCGVAKSAQKPTFFGDGKRLWFSQTSGQSSGGIGDFQWYVLECRPTLYDCRDRKALDVDFPIDSISDGAQNREATPDDRGELVAWNEVRSVDGTHVTIARLKREPDRYVLVDPRVVNPQFTLSGDSADWINGGRFYEGGDFVDGGRFLKYQRTSTGLNYDTGLLDLRTGRYRPLTTDLDYNETADVSPDGRWALYSSARGLDRMDVFTQLVRPSFIDMSAFGQIASISLFGNRRCMNERWLMSRHFGQRLGGYAGQPLVLSDDWNVRTVDWFDDSRTFLLTETRSPNRQRPAGEANRARTRIVRLPGLAPTKPLSVIDVDSLPWQRWTVPSSDYTGMAGRQVVGQVVHGRASGTATMNFSGTFAAGSWSVAYDDYSDDGRSFIDGTESVTVPGVILVSDWMADLTIHGQHDGYLKGNLQISLARTYKGTVESEVDGVHRVGVPQQADCPAIERPPLRVRIAGRRHLGRGLDRLSVEVRARVPEDSRFRPVEAALVRGADGSARTDARGLASLDVEPGAPLRITAGGFKPAQLAG